MKATGVPILAEHLAAHAPPLLYHYSSYDGLLGILKSKEMWASNVAFLNDSKEVRHAVDYAKNAIENKIGRGGLSEEEIATLKCMHKWSGTAATRYYIVSFSEDGDLLSQWRAYCPPGGGCSIGIPAAQLISMCQEQGFTLVQCIYDHRMQSQIVNQLIDYHLAEALRNANGNPIADESMQHVSWQFAQHLTEIACAVKHSAFSEEREWRLISSTVPETHPQLDFRGTPAGVVPFFHFKLSSESNPELAQRDGATLIVQAGPTSDRDLASTAMQFLTSALLPGSAFAVSDIPLRKTR